MKKYLAKLTDSYIIQLESREMEVRMKRSHDSPSEKTENWEWLYGKLEPGVYRIGKSMIDDLRMGDARFNKFRITKQFQIFE